MSQNEESKVLTHQSVLAEVADSLKAATAQVRSQVKELLVSREVSKRVDLLDKGLAKLRDLKKEVEKVRPVEKFSADGTKLPGEYTKADWQTRSKAQEKVTKLENALEKAFAGQEFDKLAGLVSGKEPAADEQSE